MAWVAKVDDGDDVINDDVLLAEVKVILHAFCKVSHKIHDYINASSLPNFCSRGKA